MPGGNGFGIFVEGGAQGVWPDFPAAARGRCFAARVEISVTWIFRVGSFEHVGHGDCRVQAESLRHGRGCEDAEFLPIPWRDRTDRAGRSGAGFRAGAEFLVPVFVSVWSVVGADVDVQPDADSAESRDLH